MPEPDLRAQPGRQQRPCARTRADRRPRAVPLRQRPRGRGHAVRRGPALAPPARPHRLDRPRAGAGAARRARGGRRLGRAGPPVRPGHPRRVRLRLDHVRYVGEPVALVAADDHHTAERACAAIEVVYEPLSRVVDPLRGARTRRRSIPTATSSATSTPPAATPPPAARSGRGRVRHRPPGPRLPRPEAGWPGPTARAASSCTWRRSGCTPTATRSPSRWGCRPSGSCSSSRGVGGAFGGREDMTIQIHACLLAMTTQRPVKMQLSRARLVPRCARQRHPGRIWMRTDAEHDGTLVSIEARVVLDGGAYAVDLGAGAAQHRHVPAGSLPRAQRARCTAWAVRTNNPTSGAFRGFGNPQASYAHEAQMDRLARALDMDPVQLRLHNALRQGDRLMCGQLLDRPTPVAEVIRRCAAMPLPPADAAARRRRPGRAPARRRGPRRRPGARAPRRGLAAVMKNTAFSESSIDESTAMVHLKDGHVTVRCAAVEVGQGFVTVARQIARTILGVDDVVIDTARHADRQRRLDLGQPPDADLGQRGGDGQRGGQAAPAALRRAPPRPSGRQPGLADGWVVDARRPAPVHGRRGRRGPLLPGHRALAQPRDAHAGRRPASRPAAARGDRLLGAARGGRRRPRARAGQGRADQRLPGRGHRGQPDRRSRPRCRAARCRGWAWR